MLMYKTHNFTAHNAHDIGCPNCDEKLGSVRKGRIDYIVTKKKHSLKIFVIEKNIKKRGQKRSLFFLSYY